MIGGIIIGAAGVIILDALLSSPKQGRGNTSAIHRAQRGENWVTFDKQGNAVDWDNKGLHD